jgi:hypothetical protein
MASRSVRGGALAAIAGAAMLSASVSPSSAFSLFSASLAEPVVDLHHVWWDRWGYWHPNQSGWNLRPPDPPLYYYYPLYYEMRRCWFTWQGRTCRWFPVEGW